MPEPATLEAPPAAVTTPLPPPPQAKPTIDPDLAQVLRDLGHVVDEDKPKDPPKLPDVMPARTTLGEAVMRSEEKRKEAEAAGTAEPPAAAPDGEEAKAPEPAPATAEVPPPVVEVKKKDTEKELQALIDKRISDAMGKMPAPAPAPIPAVPAGEAPKTEAVTDDYEKKLGEIELEELRFARFAAQKDPNLKDYPTQLIDYLKKAEAYGEKVRKDDPERTLDDDDQEWRKWQRENKPKFSPVLRRKLEREQIMEEATLAAEARLQPKYAAVERRQELLEKRPVIERITHEFATGLDELMESAPEGEDSPVAPIVKRVKEAGWGKVLEEDPLFAPIVHRVSETANRLAGEYLAIVNGTTELNLQNENHAWLSKFITDQGEEFAAKGGDAAVRVDNLGQRRQFLPRHKFAEVASSDPSKAAQFWTWNDTEVLQRIAVNAKKNALNMIRIESDKLAKAGFERKKPEPVKQVLPKKENDNLDLKANGSPKAPSSVAPGVAQPAKVNGPASLFSPDELKIMVPGLNV